MISKTPDWVKELPHSISAWFEIIMDDGPVWGRFKDCIDAKLPYYLPATGAAAATIDMLNISFPGATPANLKARAEWALPMQDKQTTFFIDAELEKLLLPKIAASPVELTNFRRAVTNYTRKFLEPAGISPRFPICAFGPMLDPDPEAIMQKIIVLDWANPWGACSQTGKLLLELYKYITEGHEEFIPTFKRVDEFLLSKQNPETGLWGDASMPVGFQMSGALKALCRQFWDWHVIPPYVNKLADSVLGYHYSGALYPDGRNGAILYERNNVDLAIISYLSSDYRKDELRAYIESVVERIAAYRQPDGAFASDYAGKLAIGWCGAMVSDIPGNPRSNISHSGRGLYPWLAGLCPRLG